QVTEAYLRRIERHDGVLKAYITVMADRALAQAHQADGELRRGARRGPLHGVPLALKDLVAVAGVRMTAGSRVLADHVPDRDADVTERLHAAGAVILGKLSMHEFAFGRPVTEGPFPTGRNPWDVTREPDGSSSGSRGADYTAPLETGVRGLKLGLLRRFYVDFPGLHADVKTAALAAFDELARQGATIEDADAPTLDLAGAIWVTYLSEVYELHRETL